MRLTAAIVALIGGLLATLAARSTWAAECAADDERVDFANVTLCISKANDLYRYTIDEFLLQFDPQTFIGDERVPSQSYYDADGNAPVEGTYVTVSIRHPKLSQSDVRQYERLKHVLNEIIGAHPGESIFEDKQEPGRVTFRRLDEFTIIGSTVVGEDGFRMSEVWLRLDDAGKIQHMLRCEHFFPPARSSMECMRWLPVGTSIATVRLSGGNQERSYRLSRQIRGDIEDFIEKGSNP